jgi:hypothetical protein
MIDGPLPAMEASRQRTAKARAKIVADPIGIGVKAGKFSREDLYSYLGWDYRSGTRPSPVRGWSFLRIEHEPLAVDHLAVLCDRHVDAGAALGMDQLDGLRHGVGIFPAVLHGFEAQAGAV